MSAEPASTIATLPLSPRKAAEELLMLRLERVGLDTHVASMRMAYRLAVNNAYGKSPLIADLARRHPCAGRGKSPAIDQALVERVIRAELHLASNAPLNKAHTVLWLADRQHAVTEGRRPSLLSVDERAALTPTWGIDVIAELLLLGPRAARERVEAFGTAYAKGHDGAYVPLEDLMAEGREPRAPASVTGVRDSFVGLLYDGTRILKARLEDATPEYLLRWPGDWEKLAISPEPKSLGRPRRHADGKAVKQAFLVADEDCAAPFLARFNRTDIEMARDPEAFFGSFESNTEARAWLENSGVALLIRNRTIGLDGLVLGERIPELTASVHGDLHLDPFDHEAVQARFGIPRAVGALLVQRSAKAAATTGGHFQPLPVEVCHRHRVWLLACEILLGRPPAPTESRYLKDLFSAGGPAGLGKRAVGTAAGAVLARVGMHPGDDRRAYNAMRRYTDNVILDFFEEYAEIIDGIPPAITRKTVKEAMLGHPITLDPETYSGLGTQEGIFAVCCYGAEIVIQTIYGTLGTNRGPDRERVASEIAIRRALNDTRAQIESGLAGVREQLVVMRASAAVTDADAGAALVRLDERGRLRDKREALNAQLDAVKGEIEAQTKSIEALMDREQWVALADDEAPLTPKALREMLADRSVPDDGPPAPIRDFWTLREVASLLGVDLDTLRGWLNLAHPERVSRRCPWVGEAPVLRPDQRSGLLAASAFEPIRIGNSATCDALRKLLSTWPAERGWDWAKGAKSVKVRSAAKTPVKLGRRPANDWLAYAGPECVRLFHFDAVDS
jgi:hypothetical protein